MSSDAPEETRDFLAERHPDALALALWVRDAVLAAEPDLIERVYPGWDGIGFRHPDGGYVCAIYPRDGEVRLLFEHGIRLDDPEQVLEGDGSQTRHVHVAALDDRLKDIIANLVRDAVAERLFRR